MRCVASTRSGEGRKEGGDRLAAGHAASYLSPCSSPSPVALPLPHSLSLLHSLPAPPWLKFLPKCVSTGGRAARVWKDRPPGETLVALPPTLGLSPPSAPTRSLPSLSPLRSPQARTSASACLSCGVCVVLCVCFSPLFLWVFFSPKMHKIDKRVQAPEGAFIDRACGVCWCVRSAFFLASTGPAAPSPARPKRVPAPPPPPPSWRASRSCKPMRQPAQAPRPPPACVFFFARAPLFVFYRFPLRLWGG